MSRYPLMIFLISSLLYAQITFERWYGGEEDDCGQSVIQTNNGGYLIAGYTESYGAGGYDVILIKTDAYGDTLWTRAYGGILEDYGYCVAQTNDSGYIITGQYNLLNGDRQVYLIKTDYLGDTLWTRTYGDTLNDIGLSVAQTDDGGYIIIGAANNYDNFYLIKTSSTGDTAWTRIYGGFGYCRAGVLTDDGGYAMVGQKSDSICFVKTDTIGIILWTKTYWWGYSADAFSVIQVSNGGYAIAGRVMVNGHYDFYLMRINIFGDTLWARTYGEDTFQYYANSIAQTDDGGFVLAGMGKVYDHGTGDVYILRTDSLGDTLWTKSYGDSGYFGDCAYSVKQTDDDGFIVTGGKATLTGPDIYLIKTDANGNVRILEQGDIAAPGLQLTVAPNPFSDKTRIVFGIGHCAKCIGLKIYDISGRVVKSFSLPAVYGLRPTVVIWNGTDQSDYPLPGGVYFVRLSADEFYQTKKVLLVR